MSLFKGLKNKIVQLSKAMSFKGVFRDKAFGSSTSAYTNDPLTYHPRDEYPENPTAASCGNVIIRTMKGLPWVVGRRLEDGSIKPSKKSLLKKLFFDRPNDQDTWETFVERSTLNIMVDGESYVVPSDSNGSQEKRPLNVRIYSKDSVSPIESDHEGYLNGYYYNGHQLDVDDVAYTRWAIDPRAKIRGFSPMTTAKLPVLTQKHAARWMAKLAAQEGLPEVQLSFRDNKDLWMAVAASEDLQEGLLDRWRKAGPGTPFFSGARVESISVTPQEAGAIAIGENAEGEINKIFGVNPLLTGDTDAASYSNMSTVRKYFIAYLILPLANTFLSTLNRLLGRWYNDAILIDISKIPELQEDQELMAKILKEFVFMGAISPNEARENAGFGPGDADGDGRIVGSNNQPLSSATDLEKHGGGL